MTVRVALIGNPNVGKSVVFNNLVPGARQHVGNWPGKTVERKIGRFNYNGEEYEIVDLPGCYSLTCRAMDELVSRTYILEEKPDVVVNITDASNIERNLYLTLLLMELETNLIVVLNQMDLAHSKGYDICSDTLASKLGIPVIETIATRKKGMEELKQAIEKAAKSPRRASIKYSTDVEQIIARLVDTLSTDTELVKEYPPRWLAIKILENDRNVTEIVAGRPVYAETKEVFA